MLKEKKFDIRAKQTKTTKVILKLNLNSKSESIWLSLSSII